MSSWWRQSVVWIGCSLVASSCAAEPTTAVDAGDTSAAEVEDLDAASGGADAGSDTVTAGPDGVPDTPGDADRWIERVHVMSAWPLDEPTRLRFGVDINGTWTYPGLGTVAEQQARGQRVLQSVQGLAGEAELLEDHPELNQAVSRDIYGEPARVPWYDWLSEPVLVLSIASPIFQDYLLGQGRAALDAGADGWFIDEIQTSALLVSREPHGAGFSADEMQAFLDARDAASYAGYVDTAYGVEIPADWDAAAILRDSEPTRAALRDAFFISYRAFQEEHAFAVMSRVIQQVREEAERRRIDLAVGANLAGLGALTDWSPLTAPIWTGSLDFIVFEFDPPDLTTTLAPYYRLGRATVPGMVAAMPGLSLAQTLNDKGDYDGYLAMSYAEAFAFEGNWALSYWTEEMGWAADALLPAELEAYTRFVREHHELFEGPRARHPVAVIYPNDEVLADSTTHGRFIELCEELLARHVQFDVLYEGDDRFRAVAADPAGYEIVLRPGDSVPPGVEGLEAPAGVLTAWYRRKRLTGPIVHLVNRRYDVARDRVETLESAEVSWPMSDDFDPSWRMRWLSPGRGSSDLSYQLDDRRVHVVVPELEVYGVIVVSAPPS